MTIQLISIGNSKGIRLSKTVIEKYQLKDSIELILEKDHIIIKPASKVREGWSSAFRKMKESKEDKLLIKDIMADENFEEWK